MADGWGGRVTAPFTPDQVASLNAYQRSEAHHPFTCAGDHDGLDEVVLAAQSTGWVCTTDRCTYQQDWAHGAMADWTWQRPARRAS